MTRKANLSRISESQLELPLGKQDTERDLSYYIGLCKVFATYHKRWPKVESTREEFRAARVHDYDGQRIDRELRFPAPSLEADPAYQALRERCQADGMLDGVSLVALDPRYRTVLNENNVLELFDTIVLPRPGDSNAARYATGMLAHGPNEITLHIGDKIRACALELAGQDPNNTRVFAASFPVRVRATKELKDFIDRVGIRGPAVGGYLADDYVLEAGDDRRLFLKFQLLSRRRYAGEFSVERLTHKLASVYRTDPVLAGQHATAPPDHLPVLAIPAAPVPESEEELYAQLAALLPEGASLKLPIQELSRFVEIRCMLEIAGGVFSAHRQCFDFEQEVDPELVIERLVSGGAR